jgi:hypothetical protein
MPFRSPQSPTGIEPGSDTNPGGIDLNVISWGQERVMSCAAIVLRYGARHFMLDDFGVDSVARGARPDPKPFGRHVLACGILTQSGLGSGRSTLWLHPTLKRREDEEAHDKPKATRARFSSAAARRLASLLARYPRDLWGGQCHRVAMGHAIVTSRSSTSFYPTRREA